MRHRAILLAAASWLTATASLAGTVGFRLEHVPDGTDPTIELGLWYPAAAPARPTHVGLFTQMLAPDAPVAGRGLPLVIISHGHGGDFSSHSDTAFALAEAGFVVVAPTHTGDNWRDESRALDVHGRARLLRTVIDWTTRHWQPCIDPGRIGAFGFSAGGLTVLMAAGGTPDLRRIGPHCQAHPAFYDCRLLEAHRDRSVAPASDPSHGPRLRALVVAAPALGYTFDRQGLRAVTMPVQLWRAADDQILPAPFYADQVRAALPNPPDFHLVPNAGHFDFLAPCSDALAHVAPEICVERPGFDRVRFHRAFNAALVDFFVGKLRP